MIKSAVLAAVAVVGIGSAAGAATVKDYDLHLRYEGTAFLDLVAYDAWNNFDDFSDDYPASDPLGLGLSHRLFPGIKVGDVVRFIATVVFPDDEEQVVTHYGNGGTAPICAVGPVSCTNTEATYQRGPNDQFQLRYSDLIDIEGSKLTGSLFTFGEYLGESAQSADGRWSYFARLAEGQFTVVQPAPVPLPASAALLPLGLGALAMMRKRRRKTS